MQSLKVTIQVFPPTILGATFEKKKKLQKLSADTRFPNEFQAEKKWKHISANFCIILYAELGQISLHNYMMQTRLFTKNKPIRFDNSLLASQPPSVKYKKNV